LALNDGGKQIQTNISGAQVFEVFEGAVEKTESSI
jgi:hypothetical protein